MECTHSLNTPSHVRYCAKSAALSRTTTFSVLGVGFTPFSVLYTRLVYNTERPTALAGWHITPAARPPPSPRYLLSMLVSRSSTRTNVALAEESATAVQVQILALAPVVVVVVVVVVALAPRYIHDGNGRSPKSEVPSPKCNSLFCRLTPKPFFPDVL